MTTGAVEELKRTTRSYSRKDDPMKKDEDKDDIVAKEEVADWIRDLILGGELQAGKLISEQELADRFAEEHGLRTMSRTPIRQGLARLAGEGLVEILPRVGTQVRLVSPDDAVHIMGLRYAMETVVVCHLAEAYTPLDFRKAEETINVMKGYAKVNQPLTLEEKTHFIQADIDFHTELAKLAGYGPAVDPLRTFSGQFLLAALLSIQDPEARRAVSVEHQAILKAIRSRKATNARKAMHHHLYATLDRWSPYAAEYLRKVVPSYFGLPALGPKPTMRKSAARRTTPRPKG
jgi:DNA-binding GntR family transcriptional regulator